MNKHIDRSHRISNWTIIPSFPYRFRAANKLRPDIADASLRSWITDSNNPDNMWISLAIKVTFKNQHAAIVSIKLYLHAIYSSLAKLIKSKQLPPVNQRFSALLMNLSAQYCHVFFKKFAYARAFIYAKTINAKIVSHICRISGGDPRHLQRIKQTPINFALRSTKYAQIIRNARFFSKCVVDNEILIANRGSGFANSFCLLLSPLSMDSEYPTMLITYLIADDHATNFSYSAYQLKRYVIQWQPNGLSECEV